MLVPHGSEMESSLDLTLSIGFPAPGGRVAARSILGVLGDGLLWFYTPDKCSSSFDLERS